MWNIDKKKKSHQHKWIKLTHWSPWNDIVMDCVSVNTCSNYIYNSLNINMKKNPVTLQWIILTAVTVWINEDTALINLHFAHRLFCFRVTKVEQPWNKQEWRRERKQREKNVLLVVLVLAPQLRPHIVFGLVYLKLRQESLWTSRSKSLR